MATDSSNSRIKREAMQRIRDATDRSGAAKFPSYMKDNMRRWEREGLVELHIVGANIPVARITEKGRRYAEGS